MSIKSESILILDFGSQYTRLIARSIREAGVYCEIWPFNASLERIKGFNPKGIILSGGPNSVFEEGAPKFQDGLLDLPIPILGICYGLQLLTHELGGEVQSSSEREYGKAQLIIDNTNDPLLKPLQQYDTQTVWMSHSDRVERLAEHFNPIAHSTNSPYAAVKHDEKPWWGIQFHPEVTHTTGGRALLKAFAIDICGCHGDWTAAAIRQSQVAAIRELVGKDKVILGLSGGVDSSVAGALIAEAIGDQLICVFVDNGLLRLNEGDEVERIFKEHYQARFIRINAERQFLDKLVGISDPEEKRKIIGNTFIEVFEEVSNDHPEVKWLGQGTIYPDVIESAAAGSGAAHVIKSHHNVGGLPDYMKLQLLEPLRDLFKDEVRQVGLELGLEHDLVYRHPFPGPGLGVRVLGEVKEEYLEPLRQADHIFIAALRKYGLYDKCSQAFAVFLPVKSVGVVGDGRAYEYVIALRAVETTDFMTATAAMLPHDFIHEVATRIINETRGISRVVYDISSKPPATIEWE